MKILKWSYTKRYNIKARFDQFPHSEVVFRQIKDYYFIYTVFWSKEDPAVERPHLEEMEVLLNRELGTLDCYLKRTALQKLNLQ
ncbi:hypothetical protein [Lederbergia citrea]|uniref:Uncharacterized protein n=1 Tax=Lederbergia citrea TaxID=2833581 RepID=A0A942UNH9_9BACI|nr:hypothetical protein [Lederbergia citrea]MBS4179283.1 hypothetical protein [Lederbergia citrea]MBS4205946.1 hypothetical protein [Lederbergia citrea]MBS4224605.1 hypothetical protein [Lederbergia citrea]